ncbi:extensin-like isoform X1 [Ixodes scapularis]
MFHSTILALEKSHLEPTELYAVMAKLRKQLINRKDDMAFGVKANQGLETHPGGQAATLDFVNIYDRALVYLGKCAGGFILDIAVSRFSGLAAFQPVINGVNGNLAAIHASRLSTLFAQRSQLGRHPEDDSRSCVDPITALCRRNRQARVSQLLLALSLPGHLLFVVLVFLMSEGNSVLTAPFVACYLVASTVLHQLAFPVGRRSSVRDYYQHRQARPGPTRIQGITFPDYELPATIYTVEPPDDFPERCRFCGGPCHPRKFCPAAHRRCFSCHKQGHLDRVCESRPRWPRLDCGGPSNPPTVFASDHRRRRKLRHPSAPRAPQSRPRGGNLPPEPPVPAAAPPTVLLAAALPAAPSPVPAAAQSAAAPSAAALPAAPTEGATSSTCDSPTVLTQPPVSVCSTPSPEPPEPLSPDKFTPRQESRPLSSRRLPGRFKSYVLTLKELLS